MSNRFKIPIINPLSGIIGNPTDDLSSWQSSTLLLKPKLLSLDCILMVAHPLRTRSLSCSGLPLWRATWVALIRVIKKSRFLMLKLASQSSWSCTSLRGIAQLTVHKSKRCSFMLLKSLHFNLPFFSVNSFSNICVRNRIWHDRFNYIYTIDGEWCPKGLSNWSCARSSVLWLPDGSVSVLPVSTPSPSQSPPRAVGCCYTSRSGSIDSPDVGVPDDRKSRRRVPTHSAAWIDYNYPHRLPVLLPLCVKLMRCT